MDQFKNTLFGKDHREAACASMIAPRGRSGEPMRYLLARSLRQAGRSMLVELLIPELR
jgi:hypothetical protein